MEKIMKVVSQGQYRESEWENKNHEKILIKSVEMELTDGIETIIAEASGDQAVMLKNKPLTKDAWYAFQLKCSIATWTRQDGTTGKATRVRVVGIGDAIGIPT